MKKHTQYSHQKGHFVYWASNLHNSTYMQMVCLSFLAAADSLPDAVSRVGCIFLYSAKCYL